MTEVLTEGALATFRIPLREIGGYVKVGTTSRKEALSVTCPKCSSAPGHDCVEENGAARRALHIDRHHHAIAHGARVRFIGGAKIFYDD